ncbi:hypothetical protein O181_079533 [Austropuccinia psidii MF-1]|uniref:Uncharacterized protein n=1 Tax=Austropuccinia psidii MF-1 TaxID=1389203 RepID=A0A9Q3FL62_9BASI|nr:hypothetical protein [Austropuccinia psidii MF-1]
MNKYLYDLCLKQSKRLKAIDPHMNIQIRNHKLLTQVPGSLEHAIKSMLKKDCTLDDTSNTLQEGRSITSICRYDTNSTGDNRENPNIEAKEAHDTEALRKTGICHSCLSPNHYGETCHKDREEIFPREEETRKTPEGSKSDSNSVGNGCGDD